jgi:PAS domain S-box-containing protein
MTNDTARSSLELLYNISRELAFTLDLRQVLSRVLDLSTRNVNAERGTLIVLDEGLNPYESVIVYEGQLTWLENQIVQDVLNLGLAGWVIRHREPALVDNTSQDERWVHRPDDDLDQTGPKSALCVPLVSRNELVGVLTIVHPEVNFFKQDHIETLEVIAGLAGNAIYNARLYNSLQAAHRRYRDLFEDNIDPILITDLKGNLQVANHQATCFFGCEQNDLSEYTIFSLHTPDEEQLGQNFEKLQENTPIKYEASIHPIVGDTFPAEIYTRLIDFGSGRAIQWILRDITERRVLDALRSDMAAMIYHDLRSPLANIISSLDMLSVLLPEETMVTIQPVLTIANRSSDRMQRLINSLLDTNRLEAGQQVKNKKPSSVNELIQESIEAVKPFTDGRHQELSAHFPENLPSIWADIDMLKRVLINLLENASKFTPPYGKIEASATVEGKAIKFCVKDTGPGIPPEARERIFEKFTRLYQSETGPKGVGLGLAFCRLAVQAHGGWIWVEGQPGQGSQFYFTIPIYEESKES